MLVHSRRRYWNPESSTTRPWNCRSCSVTAATSPASLAVDHPLDRLGEGVEVVVGDDPAGPREGPPLEQGADPVDRLDLGLGDAHDHRPAMREELDQPLLLQLAKRLADRSAADPQLVRERDLEQARAGRDIAGQDPGAQPEQDLVAEDSPLDGWEVRQDAHGPSVQSGSSA